jgi:hypothetical protein
MTTNPTEIRFAPAVAAMAAFLEPHRAWIESALGCGLRDAVRLEVEIPFGQLAVETLLAGAPLDDSCLAGAAPLRAAVERWELPPGASPRIALEPSRKRGLPLREHVPAWDPHWRETPVAVWLRGLRHAAVAVNIPFVSYAHGLDAAWRPWLLANPVEVGALLALLRGLVFQPRTVINVCMGRDIPLGAVRYDWADVVLDVHAQRLVRDDFEAFLDREEWFRRRRLPFRRGYLFHGPPGNGKTSVIRVMTAHPAMTSFALDFSNEHADDSELSAVFEAAGRSAPSLVILEDLDRLFGKRAGVPNPHNRTRITFQHLLGCLDGLGSQDGVIVVATANDPTELDAALLRRPGRFDRVVAFPPPPTPLRAEYLRRLTGGALPESAVARAARETEGFSFAQVREAYIVGGQLAFRRGAGEVTLEDLREGIGLVRAETAASGQSPDARPAGFGAGTLREDGAPAAGGEETAAG